MWPFSPPPNFYALRWGVDLALFSATKYMGGHGDIVSGILSGRRDLVDQIRWYRDTTGPVADGNAAFLLRRSLYTLPLRMERVNAMGMTVARYLEDHPAVRKIYYTGLESHPHFKLGETYLAGHGGVITFELGLSEAATDEVVGTLAGRDHWPPSKVNAAGEPELVKPRPAQKVPRVHETAISAGSSDVGA